LLHGDSSNPAIRSIVAELHDKKIAAAKPEALSSRVRK